MPVTNSAPAGIDPGSLAQKYNLLTTAPLTSLKVTFPYFSQRVIFQDHKMSQLMKLCYLSHRRPAKAQASLRIRAVSREPSLFAHMKSGSRRNQASSPTGWLRMRVWRTSLRRTKSTIISWHGSINQLCVMGRWINATVFQCQAVLLIWVMIEHGLAVFAADAGLVD